MRDGCRRASDGRRGGRGECAPHERRGVVARRACEPESLRRALSFRHVYSDARVFRPGRHSSYVLSAAGWEAPREPNRAPPDPRWRRREGAERQYLITLDVTLTLILMRSYTLIQCAYGKVCLACCLQVTALHELDELLQRDGVRVVRVVELEQVLHLVLVVPAVHHRLHQLEP